MYNKDMVKLGTQRSVIRELFEWGNERAKAVGRENILDFSMGNPNVPAPAAVQDAIMNLVKNESPVFYHSYTSSAGLVSARKAIADNLNKRFDTNFTENNLYLTCGAAASLNITLKALTENPDNEVIAVAPFFPEYRFFTEAQGAKFVVLEADLEHFQIDFEKLETLINENTKAIIINTPNNPSGVIYSEETIERLAKLLTEKSEKYGHPIFIISDEPYRELVYGGIKVPFVTKYYRNTIVNYSWSKSLSLPGERIGYILIPSEIDEFSNLYAAVAGAARILGFVCAPSLFQRVIEKCVDQMPDVTVYETNRNLLYDNLTAMGYKMAKPDGAFYAFIEAPDKDSKQFSEYAKEKNMLIVPGAGFGTPSYVRLSYCVDTETVKKSIKIFEEIMNEKYK